MTSTLTYIQYQPKSETRFESLNLPVSTPENEVNDVIISQLSSPIQSYEVNPRNDFVTIKHPQSYRARLKSAKSIIEELRSDVRTLKRNEAERKRNEAEREQILLDWEIRTRIAQGLNDVLIKDLPEDVLTRLKNERCGYLPASLSNWASHCRMQIPALDLLSDDDFFTYSSKGANIQNKGLADDINTIWNSIPEDKLLLLISMWVSRPDTRRDISHPTPTIDQAERLVEADRNLGPREVFRAREIIRMAVDKYNVPLFRNADSESRME